MKSFPGIFSLLFPDFPLTFHFPNSQPLIISFSPLSLTEYYKIPNFPFSHHIATIFLFFCFFFLTLLTQLQIFLWDSSECRVGLGVVLFRNSARKKCIPPPPRSLRKIWVPPPSETLLEVGTPPAKYHPPYKKF